MNQVCSSWPRSTGLARPPPLTVPAGGEHSVRSPPHKLRNTAHVFETTADLIFPISDTDSATTNSHSRRPIDERSLA
jgi:hypothetical protein